MIIIAKTSFSGFDLRHSNFVGCFVKNGDGMFDIPKNKIIETIIDDIMASYGGLERDEIRNAIINRKEYCATCSDMVVTVSGYRVAEEHLLFDFRRITTYKVQKMENSDVRYLIVENYYAPQKDIACVGRFFLEPFKSYTDAVKCLEKYKPMFNNSKGYKMDISIDVIDISKEKNRAWFIWNKKAIEISKAVEEECRFRDLCAETDYENMLKAVYMRGNAE